MFSLFRRIAQISVFTLLCGTTQAQQTIEFNSLDKKLGFPALLSGRAQYTDKISGVFTRPTGVAGNVPVMVIMHSSGGINETTWVWSKFFLDMGIATFVVDSFKPRGIQTTTLDQSQLNYAASTADSLRALKIVSDQSGIDHKRIGVIGFSRGALAAASSSFEKVRTSVLGSSDLKFALHIPVYGGCTQIGTTTGAPLLYFVGQDDDFVSADSCTLAVKKMRDKGANVADYVLYPNVYHGFDVDRPKDVYIANAQSAKNCVIGQDLDNSAYYAEGKQVTAKEYGEYYGKCMTRGSTVGFSNSATADARAKTKAFVLKTFGM
jgi:dienelactone hydrolase